MSSSNMLKFGTPLVWYDGDGLARTAQAGDAAGTWLGTYGPAATVLAGTPTIQPGPNGTRAVEYVGTNQSHFVGVSMPSAITVAFVAWMTWDSSLRDDVAGASHFSHLFVIRSAGGYRGEMWPENIWIGFAGFDGTPRVVAPHGMTGTRWGVVAASMSSTQANLVINGRIPDSFVARVAGSPVGEINRIGDYGLSTGTRRIARLAAWPYAMSEQELINLSHDWMSEFGLISPRSPFSLLWPPPVPETRATGDLGLLDAQAIVNVLNNVNASGGLGSLDAQVLVSVLNHANASGGLGSLDAQAIVSVLAEASAYGTTGQLDAQAIVRAINLIYGLGQAGSLDGSSQVIVPRPTWAVGEFSGLDGSANIFLPRFSTQTPAALAIAIEFMIPSLAGRVLTYRAPESFTLPYVIVYPVSELTYLHSGPIHHQVEILRAEVRAKTAAEADAFVDMLYSSPPIEQFLVGFRRAISCYRRNVFRSIPFDRDEAGHDLHRRIIEYQVVVEVNQRLQ